MADLTAQGYQPTDAPDLVNGDYKKMLADLQALNTQVGDMVQQVATLVSSDSTLSSQVAALQSKNTEQDVEIQSLQDSLSQGLVYRGRVNDVHNLRQMGIYSSDSAANAPQSGYVTYVCILQNNDSNYPVIFGLCLSGPIYNCWKTTSGAFSSWRRIDS